MNIIEKFSILLDDASKKKIYFIVFLTLISTILELLGISLIAPFITAVINKNINDNEYILLICKMFNISDSKTLVYTCIILIIIVFLFKGLFIIYTNYYRVNFIYDARSKLQCNLLSSILSRPYNYFLNIKTGEVIRTIQTDVINAFSLLTNTITLIGESFVAIAIVIYVFVIDFEMSLLLIGVLSILLIILRLIVKPILIRKGKIARNNIAISNKWLIEAIQGVKQIKTSRREELFVNNYKDAINKYGVHLKWYVFFSIMPRVLIEMWCVCGLLIVVLIMLERGYSSIELLPTIGAYCMAAIKIMPYANHITAYTSNIDFNMNALDKVVENVVDNSVDTKIKNNVKLNIKHSIKVVDLSYKYPNTEKYILKNANVEIPIGKVVGVIGKSGEGKTTLVDLLLGLLKQESGQILVDNKSIEDNYDAWLSEVSYIPQNVFLLDDSIVNNITFGFKKDEKRINKVLKQAQLLEFVKGLPDGLDTLIGERGVRLSGGQRQRIGIARALYTNPQILIFDEATSSLDKQTEDVILEAIESLHHNKTLIIIAHNLDTIKNCDVVYRVHKSKISKVR